MASELAKAIVEASVMMQKREEEEQVLAVVGYLTKSIRYHPGLVVVSVSDGENILGKSFFGNYFAAIQEARKQGYRLMQGDVATKLIQQANNAHKDHNDLFPVYALFQRA